MRTPVFKGNVVVSNLPGHVTSAVLAELFDPYGLVLGAKIERWHDRPGGSQGLVDLAPETAVEKAIAELNGHAIGAHKITVRRAPKPVKAARRTGAAGPAPRKRLTASSPSAASQNFVAVTAPTRQIVVEYRTPKRFSIPPRAKAEG